MQIVKTIRAPFQLPTSLSEIFPLFLSDAISKCGAPRAEEIRLHRNRLATVTCEKRNYFTNVSLNQQQINELLKQMCGGSLYAYTHTICQGYLTLRDGIRVGICGYAALENQRIMGVSEISSLIIRIPHPPKSISTESLIELLSEGNGMGGLLIYAPPGVGKTTLLRKMALDLSRGVNGRRTVVVDTREELASSLDGTHHMLDILLGYPRAIGIEIAVRSLGAEIVICDEIGNPQDADAILQAANCGVPLVATTHAATVSELLRRPAIRQLHEARAFYAYVGIQRHAICGFQYTIHKREDEKINDMETTGRSSPVGSGSIHCF